MPNPKTTYLILTRFNCRFVDRDFAVRSEPGWLEGRFALFERYCLPTIKAQSNSDFEWFLYFDAQTPPQYIDHAKTLLGDHENFHLRFCDYYTGEFLIDDLKSQLSDRCEWLVSTRLDNDDGLNADFIQALHREVTVGCREAINFRQGLILSRGRTYLTKQASNAFVSLSEPYENFKTALCAMHKDMARHAPLRDVEMKPLWLQVIHGGNVSNKVRGRRLLRTHLPSGFEPVADFSDKDYTESPLAASLENMTFALAWSGRDLAARVRRQIRGYAD